MAPEDTSLMQGPLSNAVPRPRPLALVTFGEGRGNVSEVQGREGRRTLNVESHTYAALGKPQTLSEPVLPFTSWAQQWPLPLSP
jgi:hypothetical protein